MLLLLGFYLVHKFNIKADWILFGLFILDYSVIAALANLIKK